MFIKKKQTALHRMQFLPRLLHKREIIDMENKKRDYALDLLKFICAIIFVLTHYEAQFSVHFPKMSFAYGKVYMGIVNELFFIVSGY